MKPIYFEIRDYGIMLYERDGVIDDFFAKIDTFHYKRELTSVGEMIRWKD